MRSATGRLATAHRGLLAAAAALAVLAAAPAARCQEFPRPGAPYDEAKRFYDDSLGVESFQWRARALEALGMTHDSRVPAIFCKRYGESKAGSKSTEGIGAEGPRQMRNFLAGLFTHFTQSGGAAEIRKLALASKDDVDAWLWYNAIRVDAYQSGPEWAQKTARDKNAGKFFRAAAIEALARNGAPETLPLVEEVLALKNLPKPGLELRLLACASASALRSATLKAKRGTPEFVSAARAVIGLLDIPEIEDMTKLCLARELAALFEVDTRERTSAPWLQRLMQKEKEKEPPAQTQETGVYPSFMGIQGRGKRFVYVLDFSDSMMVPLAATDQEELEKGGRETAVGVGEEPNKTPPIHLDWTRVKTRLDAARECLRLSLRDLTEDKYFSIVIFGDVAECFKSTPGLVKATPAAVKAAEKELDTYDPTATTTAIANKPGLRGKTNLHGGLRFAFRLTEKGPIPNEDEHVNAAAFATGADTIFLLTDGIPNWDDYPGRGPIEKNRGSGDPETGQRTPGVSDDQIYYNYPGPYADRTFYLRDLLRMNLFRKVEIHCVGIGEAHTGWLEATARLGLGKSRRVGKDSR